MVTDHKDAQRWAGARRVSLGIWQFISPNPRARAMSRPTSPNRRAGGRPGDARRPSAFTPRSLAGGLTASITFCATALATAAFSPAYSQTETTLPQVFALQCDWEHETDLDTNDPAPQFANQVAYSSSSRPTVVETETFSAAFEVGGVAGTRHFVMPDIGAALAGLFITVFSDGHSVRAQIYRIHGELAVHSAIGTCEVIE